MGSYDIDPDDGLKREIVGPWVSEKHKLLQWYIDGSRSARAKIGGQPCFVDLYCGPGRITIRNEVESRDGGTLVALNASLHSSKGQPAPFARAYIADIDPTNTMACTKRIGALNIPVVTMTGRAEETVKRIAQQLPRHGLHVAYLDPYALDALPFSIIRELANVPNVDLVLHYASGDLRRNLENPTQSGRFEAVAPGWAQQPHRFTQRELRHRFFEHWLGLVEQCKYHVASKPHRVRNSKHSEMYMLTLVSKHPLGGKIWDSLRPTPQGGFDF